MQSVSRFSKRRPNYSRKSTIVSPIIEPLERRLFLTAVVVNSATDTHVAGLVDLRDAIATANASTSATTITFDPTAFATAKTITLKSVLQLTNTKETTTITGSTAGVTISGNKLVQGFFIDSGVTATFTSLTISNFYATNGAGIESNGTLTLKNDTISNNDATSNDDGGGLELSGTTTLVNVTLANNTGDAIDQRSGALTMMDCTVSGNISYGSYSGGGVYDQGGTTTIGNTIIAGNKSAVGGVDVFGPFISKGHNLIGETDGSTGWVTSDLVGTKAKPLSADLGALANNGGPTQTFLPLAGSPVINAGLNSLVPSGVTTDQRGLTRIVSGTVDIGAVEVQVTITIKPPANQTAKQSVSSSVLLGSFTETNAFSPYKVTINWGDGSANTVLTMNAAGTIPATAHAFAKSGAIIVTESITDAKNNPSNKVTFTETVAAATTANISGEVFNDANGDGKLDDGELGLGLWTVDLYQGNTLLKTTTTSATGAFSFATLLPGTYTLKIVQLTGTVSSTPVSGQITVVLNGTNSTTNLFGEKSSA